MLISDGGSVSTDAIAMTDGAAVPPMDAIPPPLDAAVDLGPTTADVFTRLGPSCEPCHSPGAAEPVAFFASEMNFQNQVVGNPALVTPGDPDGSRLVQLLEGTAEGNFTQMPLADAFINLEVAGQTEITMVEIRRWISGL
jgi:hypothetical protein